MTTPARSRALTLALAALAATLASCETCAPAPPTPPETPPEVTPPPPDPLAIDITHTDFARNPDLLRRLRSSPHSYFRFIHREFSTEVCEELGDSMRDAPPVNLHGDAHLEQYAVTDLGRGLTDFDGATTGPAVLDLARLGVSVTLACEALGWESEIEALFSRLLEGYLEGLEAGEDTPTPPEPSAVVRIREEFEANPQRLTDTVDAMMLPCAPEEESAIRAAMEPYVHVQLEQDPSLGERFFDVVRVGRLDLGIGSALDEKFLIRVRGPTDSPDDDVVLEAKEVRSLAGIPCIQASAEPDPFRILLGQARIAYRPFPYLGFVHALDTVFWMHGWTNHYYEMRVDRSYEDLGELRQIVYDIGVQLGRGHVNAIATPLDVQLRHAQSEYIARHEDELRGLIARLSVHTTETWREFVRATEDHPALQAPVEEEP